MSYAVLARRTVVLSAFASVDADPDNVLFVFGRRVLELREARGLTQDQLAGTLQIDASYLRAIEAGKINMPIRALVELANALDRHDLGDPEPLPDVLHDGSKVHVRIHTCSRHARNVH